MNIKMLGPRIAALPPVRQALRAGDERIRGNSLKPIRERIFRRDRGLCQCARCKATGDAQLASIVDHVVPLWAGGKEDDSNRSSISRECHDAKSRHEAACRARGCFEPWIG